MNNYFLYLGVILFIIPLILISLNVPSNEGLMKEICNSFEKENAVEVCSKSVPAIRIVEWGSMISGFLLFIASFFID